MCDTEILLIRHGETEWNLCGRWQGHADSALSKRGIAQAVALGKRMANRTGGLLSIPVIWKRAQHTARLVGRAEWLVL